MYYTWFCTSQKSLWNLCIFCLPLFSASRCGVVWKGQFYYLMTPVETHPVVISPQYFQKAFFYSFVNILRNVSPVKYIGGCTEGALVLPEFSISRASNHHREYLQISARRLLICSYEFVAPVSLRLFLKFLINSKNCYGSPDLYICILNLYVLDTSEVGFLHILTLKASVYIYFFIFNLLIGKIVALILVWKFCHNRHLFLIEMFLVVVCHICLESTYTLRKMLYDCRLLY